MVSNAVRSIWAEPRAPQPPARVWRDWVLVAVLVATAILEAVFRPDLVWRPVALVARCGAGVPAAVAAHAPARRGRGRVRRPHRGHGRGPGRRRRTVGLDTMVFVLLLPYALFRWGSGREVVIGLGIILVAYVLGIASDDVSGVGRGGARDRGRAVPGGARRRGPLPDLGHAPASSSRSGSASGSSSRASCTTPSRTTSRPSRSGRRPVGSSPGHRSRGRRRRARGHRGGGLARRSPRCARMVGVLRDGRASRARPAARRRPTSSSSPTGSGVRPRVEVHLSGDLDHLGPSVDARSTGSRRSRSPTRCGTPATPPGSSVVGRRRRRLRAPDRPRRRRCRSTGSTLGRATASSA